MISLIAAMGRNRVIGSGSEIPWKIKGEMSQFKKLTTGNVVIFGRKTWEAMGSRALPNRDTIVVTREVGYSGHEHLARSVYEAVAVAYGMGHDRVYIGGGAEIYQAALPMAAQVYLTTIDVEPEGDVLFPRLGDEWDVDAIFTAEVSASTNYTRRLFRRVTS